MPARHPIIVVGAGPVGLALAIDLAQRGVAIVLLDDDDTLATGSRAICFAKRTLEIFDRLGCGDRMVAKGVSWSVGRVFFGQEQVYGFDLLPDSGHERPAFVNLQQYYVEGYLVERAAQLPLIDLRWKSKVVGVERHPTHVALSPPAPPTSSPPRATSAGCFVTPFCTSPGRTPSRARWSTAGGCRCRPCCAARR